MKKKLIHSGVKGQKWGVRRYQNEDGSLTALGREHYGISELSSINRDVDSREANKIAVKNREKYYSKINFAKKKEQKAIEKQAEEKYGKEYSDKKDRWISEQMRKNLEGADAAKRDVDKWLESVLGEYAVLNVNDDKEKEALVEKGKKDEEKLVKYAQKMRLKEIEEARKTAKKRMREEEEEDRQAYLREERDRMAAQKRQDQYEKAYARSVERERERYEKKQKKATRKKIISGILGAATAAGIGYGVYKKIKGGDVAHSDDYISEDDLKHYGVKGQKHGVRRYQNEDGSLTAEGYEHYGYNQAREDAREEQQARKRRLKILGVVGGLAAAGAIGYGIYKKKKIGGKSTPSLLDRDGDGDVDIKDVKNNAKTIKMLGADPKTMDRKKTTAESINMDELFRKYKENAEQKQRDLNPPLLTAPRKVGKGPRGYEGPMIFTKDGISTSKARDNSLMLRKKLRVK